MTTRTESTTRPTDTTWDSGSRYTRRTVEVTTWIGEPQRYLVRAEIDIGRVMLIYPIEIREISGRLYHRPAAGFSIATRLPVNDLTEARKVLQDWARRLVYIGGASRRLPLKLKAAGGLLMASVIAVTISAPTPAAAQAQLLLPLVSRGALLRGLAATEGRMIGGAAAQNGARVIIRNPRSYNSTMNFAPSIHLPSTYGGGYGSSSPRRCSMVCINGRWVQHCY